MCSCISLSLFLSQDSVFLAAFLPHFARFLFLGGLGWSLQSPTRAKQGGGKLSASVQREKFQVVLPRAPGTGRKQRNSGRVLGFFGQGEPGLAFVSWVCLQGYLDVKHSSNSCCILAQDFGRLTGLQGKTKCLSCKLITGLSIFPLSGEFAMWVVQPFALKFLDF